MLQGYVSALEALSRLVSQMQGRADDYFEKLMVPPSYRFMARPSGVYAKSSSSPTSIDTSTESSESVVPSNRQKTSLLGSAQVRENSRLPHAMKSYVALVGPAAQKVYDSLPALTLPAMGGKRNVSSDATKQVDKKSELQSDGSQKQKQNTLFDAAQAWSEACRPNSQAWLDNYQHTLRTSRCIEDAVDECNLKVSRIYSHLLRQQNVERVAQVKMGIDSFRQSVAKVTQGLASFGLPDARKADTETTRISD